jgi:hypothetical protein
MRPCSRRQSPIASAWRRAQDRQDDPLARRLSDRKRMTRSGHCRQCYDPDRLNNRGANWAHSTWPNKSFRAMSVTLSGCDDGFR